MDELPLGFGMALAQHPDVMQYFASQSPAKQQAIIDHTHQIQSKEEMHRYVMGLSGK